MTTSIPTPKDLFANRKQASLPPAPKPVVQAPIEPSDPGTVVRPGMVKSTKSVESDGVVKAKHLRKGQRVRPWVRDKNGVRAPRGSERVVESVTRTNGGAQVEITWATPHVPETRPAAYRFHDASLEGQTVNIVVAEPGFVAYHEEA